MSDLLAEDRVVLLDSPAVRSMLGTDLNVTIPAGAPRFSESSAGQLEELFRNIDSRGHDAMGRLLSGLPPNAALVSERDAVGLLLRLIETDSLEHVNLTGVIEFLKHGGRIEDIQMFNVTPFLRVMEQRRRNYTYRPLGINMLRVEHLYALIQAFAHEGSRPSSFTMLALQ